MISSDTNSHKILNTIRKLAKLKIVKEKNNLSKSKATEKEEEKINKIEVILNSEETISQEKFEKILSSLNYTHPSEETYHEIFDKKDKPNLKDFETAVDSYSYSSFINETEKLIGEKISNKWDDKESHVYQWKTEGELKSKLQEFLNGGFDFSLGYKEFNQILILLGIHQVSRDFFDAVFDDKISSLKQYKKSINNFRIMAMLNFGNIKYAFRYFSENESKYIPFKQDNVEQRKEIWKKYKKTKEELILEFNKRPKELFPLLKIEKSDRHFISEINPKKGTKSENHETVRKNALHNSALYISRDYIDVYVATSMRTKKQFEDVATKIDKIFQESYLKTLDVRYFDPTMSDAHCRITKGLIEALMLKRAKVTLYLAQDSDSLGKDSELASTLAQGKEVIVLVPEINIGETEQKWQHLIGTNLKEELSYLRKIAISYIDQECKDNEKDLNNIICTSKKILAAHNLSDLEGQSTQLSILEKNFYDRRASILKDDHPLGLQVNISTGVAHGVIVVRTESEAAKMIFRTLTNSHKYKIITAHTDQKAPDECCNSKLKQQNSSLHLVEEETGSVVRFSTNDSFLAKSFWGFYTKN